MLQLIFFLLFIAAKDNIGPIFPLKYYFPGAIVSLREAKCDLMCLEAAGSQQGHSELKALLI